MLDKLPDETALYAALLAGDGSYDGRVWVGVTSTGIFCRLTCPARKPKPENCQFFTTPAACLEAGFRPCRRCHPLEAGGAGPDVRRLLAALEAAPDRRWQEADLIAMGLDPSTIRRAFRRLFGMTFLDLARQRRLGAGLRALAGGHSVISAQMQAGYESPAAFRAGFARYIGVAPGKFRRDAAMKVDWIDTEIGAMVVVADAAAIHLLEFADRAGLAREVQRLFQATPEGLGFGSTPVMETLRQELAQYFNGQRADFTPSVRQAGTPFQHRVWSALRQIPAGQTCSYGDLARAIGQPTAIRAVARANGANTIAILVPCHRVIGANGALTGYGGGLWRKEKLIHLERHYGQNRSLPE